MADSVIPDPDRPECVIPAPGWEWCGYCNGEGQVSYTAAGPNLVEFWQECDCDDGLVERGSGDGATR